MELVSQDDKWKIPYVACLASIYCRKYLTEYIRSHSGPSKIARSLGWLSINDVQIVFTVMQALEDIRTLEEKCETKECWSVISEVLSVLHELGRFGTKKLLIEELKRAGYPD